MKRSLRSSETVGSRAAAVAGVSAATAAGNERISGEGREPSRPSAVRHTPAAIPPRWATTAPPAPRVEQAMCLDFSANPYDIPRNNYGVRSLPPGDVLQGLSRCDPVAGVAPVRSGCLYDARQLSQSSFTRRGLSHLL